LRILLWLWIAVGVAAADPAPPPVAAPASGVPVKPVVPAPSAVPPQPTGQLESEEPLPPVGPAVPPAAIPDPNGLGPAEIQNIAAWRAAHKVLDDRLRSGFLRREDVKKARRDQARIQRNIDHLLHQPHKELPKGLRYYPDDTDHEEHNLHDHYLHRLHRDREEPPSPPAIGVPPLPVR
jgi:hypothetical protein